MCNFIRRVLCTLALCIPTLAMADEACDQLKSGLLVEVFGSEAGTATYRPGSKYVPHQICTAIWNKPDFETLSAAFTQYETQRAMAKAMKKEFDEIAPPSPSYSVSLTILDQEFDSAEAAVASLENAVAELSEGVTLTVQGKENTSQVSFGDWIEGVGNKAIWAPELSELQVADSDRRFAIAVKGFADAQQNFSKAVDLAVRVVEDN